MPMVLPGKLRCLRKAIFNHVKTGESLRFLGTGPVRLHCGQPPAVTRVSHPSGGYYSELVGRGLRGPQVDAATLNLEGDVCRLHTDLPARLERQDPVPGQAMPA